MITIPRAPRSRRTLFLIGVLAVAVYFTFNLVGEGYTTTQTNLRAALPHADLLSRVHSLQQHQKVLGGPPKKVKHPAPGFEDALPSCRVYDLPDDPLVREYGQNNIRLSRTYEGSGWRVRKVLEKALRGEAISIAVVGGSVSTGHGIGTTYTKENYMYWRLRDWFETTFPDAKHTMSVDGAVPATTAWYFSFCVHEYIPEDVDLVIMELDINHYDPFTESLQATEALYRTILEMPQQPAIIYASIFALVFPDMTHGWRHTALISQWMDVPQINLRNFVIPQLMKHPEEVKTWFYSDWSQSSDLRHINARGHRTIADMIIGYLREQLCLLQREGPFEAEGDTNPAIPKNDIIGTVPRIGMLGGWDETKAMHPARPFCKAITSARDPLKPLSSSGWEPVSRNDKRSFETTEAGSKISFRVSVQDGFVSFFFWRTKDESFGAVRCWIDDDQRPDRIRRTEAWDAVWGFNIFEQTQEMWRDISPGDHTLTCVSEKGITGGTTFRISAVVAR